MKPLKFIVVGHIDHGKSTLIGRLLLDTNSLPEDRKEKDLAFIVDHLKEERERKITIDTSQTFFKTKKRDYVIIDAPGHQEFIKNMLTGATQAEAGVLILDAKEGVKEQTKRHAYLLSLIGIPEIIVLINKMDLVGYKKEVFEEVKEKIENFLEKIHQKPKFVLPISALEGENIIKPSQKMEWFKGPSLTEALDMLEGKKDLKEGSFVFSVQGIFENKVLGRVEKGKVVSGKEVFLFPSKKKLKISAIKKYKEDVSEAEAGECIGLEIESEILPQRGEILVEKEDFQPKNELLGNVFLMENLPLEVGEEFLLRVGVQETPAFFEKIEKRIDSSSLALKEENAKRLLPLDVGEVKIKTKKEILIKEFSELPELGRFVIEKKGDIVGAGIIKKL